MENAEKIAAVKKTFRFLAIIGFIPSGGAWLAFCVYYFFMSLAFLGPGLGIALGEMLVLTESGQTVDDNPAIFFTYHYFFMTYLFVTAILGLLSTAFKIRQANSVLAFIYVCTAMYGFISLAAGLESFYFTLYLIIYGLFGIFMVSKTLNQFDDLKALSQEEGYPDFIINIDQPRSIVNTRGILSEEYEEHFKPKEQERKKVNDLGNSVFIKDDNEKQDLNAAAFMEELYTDFAQPIDEYFEKELI